MSTLAFVADIHIGNPSTFGGPVMCGVNTRGEQVLETLRKAVHAVKGFDALVICGDLFDTSNPSPQLIRKVQEILRQAPHVIVLLGNHDMVSNLPGDHALGPLRALPNVTVVERPELIALGDTLILAIPFQPGDGRHWLPEVMHTFLPAMQNAQAKKVMAFHLGIADAETPSFLRDAHDAVPIEMVQQLMDQYGVDYAYCGNWHAPARWGTVVQCGALCPTGWDNPGLDYGLVRRLNTETGLMSNIHIPGPRFLVAHTEEDAVAAKVAATQRKCDLYLSLKGDAANDLETVRGWGVQARAVHDTAECREATHAAAKAVRGSGTLKEALSRYIEQMPLAEGVDRQEVQAMSLKYLTTRGE